VLDPVLLDQPLEVPARAEHRDGQARLVERLLVDEPDGLEPELGVGEQAVRRELSDASGPDDQGRPGHTLRAAAPSPAPVKGHSAGSEIDHAERDEAQRL
jgi:hypothetical protein